jgi:hypothetical protein
MLCKREEEMGEEEQQRVQVKRWVRDSSRPSSINHTLPHPQRSCQTGFLSLSLSASLLPKSTKRDDDSRLATATPALLLRWMWWVLPSANSFTGFDRSHAHIEELEYSSRSPYDLHRTLFSRLSLSLSVCADDGFRGSMFSRFSTN